MLAGAGFGSIVAESWPSARQFWDDAIEVRSIGHATVEIRPSSVLRPGRLRNTVLSKRKGRMGAAGEVVLYAGSGRTIGGIIIDNPAT